MLDLPTEHWEPSPLYPGIWASTHGRILREPHKGVMPHGGERMYQSGPVFGSITSAAKGARHVYFGTHYRGIGNIKVHRAVCSAFHGLPPFDGAVVIHVNECALDNRPDNLKWGTQKENLNAPAFRRYREARKGGRDRLKSAEIYCGLPQLVEILSKRELR